MSGLGSLPLGWPLLAVFVCADAAMAVTYRLTDLGTLPGRATSVAWSINDAGEVVGESGNRPTCPFPRCDDAHAFLYSGGVMTDLGTLSRGNDGHSRAFDINDAGQIVGEAVNTTLGDLRAFLYSGGVMTDLGTLGGENSRAVAINNVGQVVGESTAVLGDEFEEPPFHAFLLSNGVMKNLGTPGEETSGVHDINNAGQLIAYSSNGDDGRVFVYRDGKRTVLPDGFSPRRINDAGQMAGWQAGIPCPIPVLYCGGRITELGTLGGHEAFAGGVGGINNAGQVVGHWPTGERDANDRPISHAFLYADGVMKDLDELVEPPGALGRSSASDINDAGEIVGGYITAEGLPRAFLLTPTMPIVAAASECAPGVVPCERLTGLDGARCVLERDRSPSICAGERVPGAVTARLVRVEKLLGRAAGATRPKARTRTLRIARDLLEQVRTAAARAERRRRHPISPACADAFTELAVNLYEQIA